MSNSDSDSDSNSDSCYPQEEKTDRFIVHVHGRFPRRHPIVIVYFKIINI